ncbi:MAG: uncharacterized protein QOG31_1203 [Thermoplasmata archaeon]|jgi:uncharacterized Tic20 family protein|nr:uncharacterized protein [Thermoplasmata archaeon]
MTEAMSEADARQWAMFTHLSALSGLVTGLGWILGPLILWLVKKDASPFVDRQGREAVNWQLTMLIGYVIGFILLLVLVGFLVLLALFVLNLVFSILAGLRAQRGEPAGYPFAIKFLK